MVTAIGFTGSERAITARIIDGKFCINFLNANFHPGSFIQPLEDISETSLNGSDLRNAASEMIWCYINGKEYDSHIVHEESIEVLKWIVQLVEQKDE